MCKIGKSLLVAYQGWFRRSQGLENTLKNLQYNRTTVSALEIGNSYVPESTIDFLQPRGVHRRRVSQQHAPQRYREGKRNQLAHTQCALLEPEALQPAPAEGQVRLLALQYVQYGR